jgi:hypothetical protein
MAAVLKLSQHFRVVITNFEPRRTEPINYKIIS